MNQDPIDRLKLLCALLLSCVACDDVPGASIPDADADTILVPTDTQVDAQTHADTTVADTTPADIDDISINETLDSQDTWPNLDTPDAVTTDTSDTWTDADPVDTSHDTDTTSHTDTVAPCTTGPDTDGDGLVDACDACPTIPHILLYDVHSDRHLARAAVQRLGCEHVIAGVGDFTDLLDSGGFGLVIMELPDARPEGAWTQALLSHVARGGAAIVGGQRLNQPQGPSVPATLGAAWGTERQRPVAFTPTWTVPLYAAPNELRHAGFTPDTQSTWTWNGAPLTPTAGRVWARAADGAAIVESNGGRTFLNGFLFDDYPYDTDGDGVADLVELLGNQIVSASDSLRPTLTGPTIDNVAASDTVRYELPILRGATVRDAASVRIHRGATSHTFPVADGRFKALTLLRPGENWVTLEVVHGGQRGYTHLELDYVPQTNPRKVRMIYAVASDGDGRFDAPFGEPNDLASAKRRLAFSARLLQALLADRMYAANLGRHTFDLVRDVAHEPEVHVWRTSATTAQWHAMDGMQMWSWIWGHMNEIPSCGDCKTVIVLGMTRYDATNDRALAHTALGGGGVALFGSATLHTFAEGLDQLVTRLEDTRDVTTLQPRLFDDSGFRRTLWANYATGLGAILHEVAHAFDLPHAVDYGDIVSRGFDHVNRLMMSREPASATTPAIPQILLQHEPIFSTPNIGRLRWHRFNALDQRTYTVNTAPQATIVGPEVRITAPAGLRVIGYARDVNGDWQVASGTLLHGANPPTSYTIPKSSIAILFPNESRIRLYLTDDQGNLQDNLIVPLP